MSEIYTGNIEARIMQCIASTLVIEIASIRNEHKLVDDLGCDSIDLVELVMSVEDEFGIEISDEDGEKITTVQQAIDYVTANAK